jgi:hypothetical protein
MCKERGKTTDTLAKLQCERNQDEPVSTFIMQSDDRSLASSTASSPQSVI